MQRESPIKSSASLEYTRLEHAWQRLIDNRALLRRGVVRITDAVPRLVHSSAHEGF